MEEPKPSKEPTPSAAATPDPIERIGLKPATWVGLIMLLLTLGGIIVGTSSRIDARPTRAEMNAAVSEKAAVLRERMATQDQMSRVEAILTGVCGRLERIDTRLLRMEQENRRKEKDKDE